MIIDAGRARAAVWVEAPAETRRPVVREWALPKDGEAATIERCITVELHRRIGGLPQRALLSGCWGPAPASGLATVAIEISIESESPTLHADGLLGGRLRGGVPMEYWEAIGTQAIEQIRVPVMLTITSGAHHPADSSVDAFSAASRLLVLASSMDQPDQLESAVAAFLENL